MFALFSAETFPLLRPSDLVLNVKSPKILESDFSFKYLHLVPGLKVEVMAMLR